MPDTASRDTDFASDFADDVALWVLQRLGVTVEQATNYCDDTAEAMHFALWLLSN